ncbi:MAG: hypothetical protein QNK38_01010, partial [Nitrospirota bacterium]|nr:hypothetical protein [Nitrospirota bacterium]MDX2419633.1 hypothetical protein [Nitrospirota bacterium]
KVKSWIANVILARCSLETRPFIVKAPCGELMIGSNLLLTNWHQSFQAHHNGKLSTIDLAPVRF